MLELSEFPKLLVAASLTATETDVPNFVTDVSEANSSEIGSYGL